MQKINFDKSEKYKLSAATTVLAFVFSVNALQDFWSWVATFIGMFLLSGFSLMLNTFAHKYAAAKVGADAKFELWTIRRFGLTAAAEIKNKPHDPLKRLFFNITTFFTNAWLVFPLLIIFFSNGQIPFAAVGTTLIATRTAYRLGKKYILAKEIEVAKICLAGPVTNIFFALIIRGLFGLSGVAGILVLINISLAISNMIPLFRLDGGQVFFNSLLLYIFGATFILGAAYLIYFLTASTALMLSLTAAALVVTLFYYFHVFK